MTFASLYPLGCIKPAWAATFCGLHALAVDDTSRGTRLAPHHSANALDKSPVDATPDPRVAPTVEIILNSRERRKVFRQSAPLAASSENVKDRVQHGAKFNRARPPNSS